MALSDLIDRIEETGKARPVLRSHRGERGLCGAYFSRLLALYAADPPRAARLAAQWRAFLDLGDDPALAYRAKGASDRFGGRWLASADAFVRAGELAEDDVNRHAYSLGAIDGLAKAGRIEEAVELGVRLAKGLDELGQDALAARARLNTANALLWADQGEAARAHLERAIPTFRREGMAVEEASARLSLSSTHLYGGDPAVAAREAAESRAIADRVGLEFLSALAAFNLASVTLVQGRADEAFAQLVALRGPLDGSTDALRLEIAIGDACLRLNLLAEAEEAYTAALSNREALTATDRAYALFGLGEVKAASDPEAADLFYAKAAHRWRAVGNRAWQAAALAARVGLRPEARSAIRLARKALESAEGSPYHETLALLALAEALIAHGRDAQEPLDRAANLVRRFGYRRFMWRIHALRARAAESPLPHYRRMVAEILRERLNVTSTAARSGFLKDKSQALGEYLALLLESPSPKRVEEVVETVRQTRAVTLLDEILRSGTSRITPEQERRLEALRLEVAEENGLGGYPDARSSEGRSPRKRGWTEATHDLGALDAVVPPKVVDGCVVLVETGGGIWAVVGERSTRLPFGTTELEEALRWLKYELQAVTADRDAPSKEALSLLRELRAGLVEPWLPLVGDGPLRICPDGLLWKVPWDAVIDGSTTSTLLLHPSLSGGRTVDSLDQVAIWIDAANDLPHSVAEELAVLTRFPHAMVMRTRKEVMASMSRAWDHIHVIGHARHNAGNPMFSALEFPDGPLYASDIARSDLQVRLACLSACETGALSLEAREEPDGLVRAFLARGAQTVLASIWPLDDAAASRFFASLYNEFATNMDLATAVHRARHSVRSWRDHPYFWASLSLFGGYSHEKVPDR